MYEILEPLVEGVREMTDTNAERIATLGGVPVETPQSIAEHRSWDDHTLGKGLVTDHLAPLQCVITKPTTITYPVGV